MKTFSKAIAAIALMAAMTTCLTACEEDSVPAYGTIMDEDAETSIRHELSPTPPVETEPVAPVEAFIQNAIVDYDEEAGEYVSVYVMLTNNTKEPQPIYYLIGVEASGFPVKGLSSITYNVSGDEHEDPGRQIQPGEQTFCIYSFGLESSDIEGIDITLYSIGNEGQYGDILDTQRYYLTEE